MTMPAHAPLRIALMIECDGPGGAELMMLDLATELRSRGHTVLPVGLTSGTGWLGSRFEAAGFHPVAFEIRSPLDFAAARQLTTILRDFRADVVHSHEFTMAIYGAAAARRAGARHVITMHGGLYYAAALRRRLAMRWAVRRSDALVGVSMATANELRRQLGVSAPRLQVIPNGIPQRIGARDRVRRELGIAPGEPLIVAVGNLYEVKGHAVLLDALAKLRAITGWRLAIAGRGEEEAPLRARAAALGIAERIHLLGFREDIPDILAAADRFQAKRGRPVTIQYCLLKGVNDSTEHARTLASVLGTRRMHINLLRYNPTGLSLRGVSYEPTSDETAETFVAELRVRGVVAHFRRSRGPDIDAACGQLRRRVMI